MASGTKTQSAVSYASARLIATKLLVSKIGGGYNPIGTGGTVEVIDRPTDTGLRPQLLNPLVDMELLEQLMEDDAYGVEEKHNGERRLLSRRTGTYTAMNKRGFTVAMTPVIRAAMQGLTNDAVLDGEQIGDRVFVWDILNINGTDLRERPLSERHRMLQMVCANNTVFVVTPMAMGATAKRALLARVRLENGEGIVCKRINAPYQAGRVPGVQYKFKLTNTLSAIVERHNQLRSVGLALLDDRGERVSVGNVTIPGTGPMPPVGSIIEVRYLYAYPNGSLFQPVFLGLRNDVDAAECLLDQRVLVREEAA